MNTKNLFFVAVAGMALTACSFEERTLEYENQSPEELHVCATMGEMTVTRGTNTSLQSTELLASSAPAVYVCKAGKTAVDGGYFYKNLVVNTSSGIAATTGLLTFNPTETLYWPQDKTGVDVYVYAPIQSALNDINADVTFAVSTSQYNDANYQASDFVWGKKSKTYNTYDNMRSTTNTIDVVMDHLLSKVIFSIKDKNGNYVSDLKKVELGATGSGNGIIKEVKINMSTGGLTPCTAEDVITFLDVATTGSDASPATTSAVAGVIPPQDIFGKTLTITIGTQTYTGTIPDISGTSSNTATLAGKNEYTFNVELDQASFNITGITINAWTSNTKNMSVQ